MPDSSPSKQRYLVTARKYRPNLFRELVAQEHVTETLKNAIRLDRLAHAYLFSGPRGVGKTTAARILAKAINCTTPLEEREDEAEPCRECNSCRSFEEGRSLGIFEIDAASNNKVDDIRDLRETVRVPPQGSRKKVYIIDEVHMLSNQAFNALLKTLEEPPPHVLFIFATTEPHKVLPTILSRCQRFDFRRIPVPDIVERLREICELEDIEADEASLMLLARKGDGALRDALSAFDQAVSLCGTTITYGELTQALGVVDVDRFFKLIDYVATHDSAGVLRLVDDVIRSGHDLQEFLTGLAEHVRNLLVARTMEDRSLIEAAESTRERYAQQAPTFTEADLLRLLMIAGDAEEEVKSSTQPRLKLETALLKMASLTRAADLQQALSKLDWLEKAVREGKLPEELPAPISSPDASEGSDPPSSPDDAPDASDERPAAPSSAASSESAPQPAPSEEEQKKSETAAREPEEAYEPKRPDSASEEPASPPSPSLENEGSSPAPSSDSERPYRDLFGTPALKKQPSDPSPKESDANGARNHDDGTEAVAVASPTPAVAVAPSADPALAEHWPDYVSNVTQESIRLGTVLQQSRPLHLEAGTLTVAVPEDFHKRVLQEQQSLLLQHLPEPLDAPAEQFHFIVQNDLEDADKGETVRKKDPYEQLDEMRREHPVVRAIFEKFGGEPVR